MKGFYCCFDQIAYFGLENTQKRNYLKKPKQDKNLMDMIYRWHYFGSALQ